MKDIRHWLLFVLLSTLAIGWSGCVVKTRKVKEEERPKKALSATLEELIRQVNHQSEAVHSFQAKMRFDLRSGSLVSGELKDYHEIKGFLLYREPDHLRMIGQIPAFGVNALDMVSDGHEFKVAFAPYKKFILGSALDHPHSPKPLENLRPFHILEVLKPAPIALQSEHHILFREEVSEGRDNFYVIYDVDHRPNGASFLRRKLWIDRFDLTLARQQLFSEGGVLESDARYSGHSRWAEVLYPHKVNMFRPRQDYGLTMFFDEIKSNLPLDDSKFELTQPKGYEVIEVGKKRPTP